jgi:hypothetical protein
MRLIEDQKIWVRFPGSPPAPKALLLTHTGTHTENGGLAELVNASD